MSLSIVDEKISLEESAIQQDIYNSIDNFQNIIFNAGAGAGKTFALIKSLKHIIDNHGERLINHNQMVMCITYTNVGVNEVKDRLGNSDFVQVSTIHESLWQLIKNHQKELIVIHVEKLNSELLKLNRDLNYHDNNEKDKYITYKRLSDSSKSTFITLMLSHKSLFYKVYDKSSSEIKLAFNEVDKQFPTIFKNIANFRKIVSTIFKIDNYERCLLRISESDPEYSNVKYDSKYNSDVLHRMLISHDTLLEYSLEMVQRYELLKRIIVDKFPYILIDEYQDTSKLVVKIMDNLSSYAETNKRRFFIGYFGDSVQNIYDDGVGGAIGDIHLNLQPINKRFNRRSYSEIVDVINKIRDDNITQESIYSDSSGGSVKFYTGESLAKVELINAFIIKYRNIWGTSFSNKLHCLVLTNKLVAELSGFLDIYLCFSNTYFYKRYYDRLNSELLSHEISKLGDTQSIIYKIVNFKLVISNPNTSLDKIISMVGLPVPSFKDLIETVEKFSRLSGDTLSSFVKSIFVEYDASDVGEYFRVLIDSLIPLENNCYDAFLKYFLNKLFDEGSDTVTSDLDIVDKLLSIDIGQYYLWFNFIEGTQDSDVVYHTYHGTKGLEYENVIVIMENDFGIKNKNKFSSFFEKTVHRNNLEGEDLLKFINTRNLLYVSCSRAIRNLRVLYLDDTTRFIHGINNIFGETENFIL
ncbi:UvrD-helicase domain-containing protein [Shewanella oncorhynchi]|uniref:UvrD-helicase domain-containing protein n=1 Tax=Shewanella oncorhynchi TaxID=2726434 RepID=UPI002E7AFAF1|nr:UvrD-helicase domain-containing protein [Shewanella oncorhynchi]WVI91584.1 UvrD-helicase domain-containing protein [Shewanella oncorhynchi]